jgi:hypothetical protein
MKAARPSRRAPSMRGCGPRRANTDCQPNENRGQLGHADSVQPGTPTPGSPMAPCAPQTQEADTIHIVQAGAHGQCPARHPNDPTIKVQGRQGQPGPSSRRHNCSCPTQAETPSPLSPGAMCSTTAKEGAEWAACGDDKTQLHVWMHCRVCLHIAFKLLTTHMAAPLHSARLAPALGSTALPHRIFFAFGGVALEKS